MSSILTNVSAQSALQTLRSLNNSMEETQGRISSGARVNEASDNAAYWSIATTMKSDNAALGAVSDAIGLGAAKVDTAYAGMQSAIDVVNEIKKKLVTASEGSVDRDKVQEEIKQLQEQLKSVAEGASFSGENWVAGADGTQSVVSGFVRNGADNTVSIKKTDYALNTGTGGGVGGANVLFGMSSGGTVDFTKGILGNNASSADFSSNVYTLDISANTSADYLAGALSHVEDALKAMTSAGAELGSISTRIDLQEDFVNTLSKTIKEGVGRLVDADMNEESTRLKALQTQQQLAIQSLSIANSESQNILSLFR